MNGTDTTRTFPAEWTPVRLKNLISSITAGVWGEEPADGEGVACIRAADFDREHLRVSLAKVPLRTIASEQFLACALAPRDLILEKSGGGDQQPVGAVVMFDHELPAVPTNFAARIRSAPDVEPRFLCYVFAATYALRLNLRSIKQTTGLQNLDVGAFLAEEWAVPSLTDQARIADFLDHETARIDSLISRKEQLIRLGEERLRTSITSSTSLPSAPRVQLRRFVAKIDQGYSPVCEANQADEGWGVLKLSAVHRGRFEPLENKAMRPDEPVLEEYRLAAGDVLVTRANTPDLVGDVCIVSVDPGRVLLPDLIYRIRLQSGLDPRFLVYVLLSASARQSIEAIARGSSQSMVKLRAGDLGSLMIPVPSEDTQREIDNRLDSLTSWADTLVVLVARQIAVLKEHRKSLITAAVTGQMDFDSELDHSASK